MSSTNNDGAAPKLPARRAFLQTTGQAALSATAIAMLVGSESLIRSARAADASKDVSILNVALALEHEAIAAYQLGAESGLLQKPVLDVAVQFQSHHKGHRDALVDTIGKLGGSPVSSKGMGQYAAELKANTLGSQKDVLMLAARLEKGAANAYLGVIPAFQDPALAQVSARLAADETMHWTVLAQALGQPLPANPLSFGA
ncbi:MAG: ferritin-like domain-containing protein [Alphaproteobacteria bacterium]|nr:ferritin-like domain-containing protein [Alphaproteobacteria bacterium]